MLVRHTRSPRIRSDHSFVEGCGFFSTGWSRITGPEDLAQGVQHDIRGS